jgi:hypothetical protein
MNRLDFILNSLLFSNKGVRKMFKALFELEKIDLTNVPLHVFYDDFKLEEVTSNTLELANSLSLFEHNTNDKKIQKLFFIILIYSIEKYPDQHSWELFLNNKTAEEKTIEISSGAKETWIKFQNELMNNWLNKS